jgi:hypothetical protein
MKPRNKLASLSVLCCAALLAVTPAKAYPVPPYSDALTGSVPGVNLPAPIPDYSEPVNIALGGLPSVPVGTAVALTEGNTDVLSELMYFWWTNFNNTPQLWFASADDNGNFAPSVPIEQLLQIGLITKIAETGDWQEVGQYFGYAGTGVLYVVSDVEPAPLPAALPLFATGLGAIGLLGWRRKRKAAAAIAAA